MTLQQIDDFCHALAIELGKSLDEIDEMSFREFLSWYRYSQRKPFQNDRIEFMIAQLTSLTYNINAKEKKSALEFMLSVSEDVKKKARQDLMSQQLMEEL